MPVWVDLEGDRIVFFTQTGTRKARNLERDGRIAISLVDGTNPYRTAQIRGRVVEKRTGDEAEVVIERIARKFTGEPFPWQSPNSVLYVVEPERVRFMALPFMHAPRSRQQRPRPPQPATSLLLDEVIRATARRDAGRTGDGSSLPGIRSTSHVSRVGWCGEAATLRPTHGAPISAGERGRTRSLVDRGRQRPRSSLRATTA